MRTTELDLEAAHADKLEALQRLDDMQDRVQRLEVRGDWRPAAL